MRGVARCDQFWERHSRSTVIQHADQLLAVFRYVVGNPLAAPTFVLQTSSVSIKTGLPTALPRHSSQPSERVGTGSAAIRLGRRWFGRPWRACPSTES